MVVLNDVNHYCALRNFRSPAHSMLTLLVLPGFIPYADLMPTDLGFGSLRYLMHTIWTFDVGHISYGII